MTSDELLAQIHEALDTPDMLSRIFEVEKLFFVAKKASLVSSQRAWRMIVKEVEWRRFRAIEQSGRIPTISERLGVYDDP